MKYGLIGVLSAVFLAECVSTGKSIPTPATNNNGQPTIIESVSETSLAQNGTVPAIVLMHGCSGVKANARDWAGRFESWGWHAVILDSHTPRIGSRGHTCETGTGKRRQHSRSGGVGMLDRAADAYGALDYLAALPHIDDSRIYVMCWSEGAATAAITVSPTFMRFYDREGHPNQYAGAVAVAPSCFVVGSNQPQVKPTLFIGGTADEWTPISECAAWVRQNPDAPMQVHAIEGATHAFDTFRTNSGQSLAGGYTAFGHYMRPDAGHTNEAVRVIREFLDIKS